ncbi:MAG TPA: metallophosphoesterase [Candidatus Binatia bacterium]
MSGLELLFPILAFATLLGVPLYAWRVRGRAYATFGFILLAIALPGALVVHARLRVLLGAQLAPWLDLAFAYCMAAAAVHLVALVRPRLRTAPFRYGVSIPGMTFIAAGALSGLWLLVLLPVRVVLWLLGLESVLHVLAWFDLWPIVVAAASVFTSTRLVDEVVRVTIADEGPDEVTRLPVQRYRGRPPRPLERRPLRIVQIADPHLGPWQPVKKLRRQIDALIDRDPDLVLLTGDFLTMEGVGTPGALAEALEPLQRAPGRCFAVFGNHDHESPEEVARALAANGVRLLLDAEAVVETPVGPVQIIGADYRGKGRRQHLQDVLARHPRRNGHLRLLLLHDPSAFKHVPKGDVDLTLSGHTHGGQLGLVSFGLDWTVLRRTPFPDHGLFGHGPNRLYVHRGTGFYGFPLRIGVPGEASCLEVVVAEEHLRVQAAG